MLLSKKRQQEFIYQLLILLLKSNTKNGGNKMNTQHINGLFEVHLAGPKTEVVLTKRIFEELRKAGLAKSKFFLGVYNIAAEGKCKQMACTPPTGHDLADPGWMTTAKTRDYESAKQYILQGMNVLHQYGLEGNFEIERLISEETLDYRVDIEKDFPDYQRVDDSPEYENHIVWKAHKEDLPSNNEICRRIEEKWGISPHQIVDFSRDSAGKSLVSRVATVYQPTREAALQFSIQLAADEKLAGHRYMVTEQVCLVGERKPV